MRLYLIRHARPDVAPGICYGSTDLPVSLPEQQAALAALLPALPKRTPVFSSPLRRCRELAALLSEALQSGEVIHDARLAELDFGAWEMRRWDEIVRAEIDAWAAEPHAYRPGGGESVWHVAQRLRLLLQDLQELEHESAIVVCHAGTIRVLSALREHPSPLEAARQAAQTQNTIGYGELILLDYQ